MMARIVYIDDDEDLRTLAEGALSARGHTVFGTNDGVEGVELIEAQRPDLIILDTAVFKLDGVELCRRLKRHVKANKTPVILLTAMTDAPTRLRGIESGGVMYMTKPFDVADFEARVETLLADKRGANDDPLKQRAPV